MPVRTINLGRKDDIASVVKQIRSIKDREIIFELERGSILLKNSDNLKLIKRTAEALGKKIQISTADEVGRVLAKKVGILAGGLEARMPRRSVPINPRVARSDVRPKFSDIGRRSRKPGATGAIFEDDEEDEAKPGRISELTRAVIRRPWRVSGKWLWSIAVIVLLFFAAAVLLPSATITVYARSEPVSRDLEITVDESATDVDQAQLVIPGTAVTREVSQTKTFQTTGTNPVGDQAAGSVYLYNFTPYTLTLKAATTTLVANGKKYSFAKDATGIRATKKTGDQIDESTATGPIQIVAQTPGEDSNLPANTQFQIQNAALGNLNVYAVNKEAITGGAAQTQKVLSQQDIDSARDSLSQEILTEAESDLTADKGQQMRVLATGVQKEVLADTANKDVGTPADDFDMTLIAKVTGIAFAENDVDKLVIGKINEVLSADKYLVENAKKEYTASFKSLDLANGKGVLSVHFETLAAYKVDSGNLTKILSGKTESEIREILLSKPEVDSVKVEFWPASLVHKAPRWNGRITIKSVVSDQQ